MKPPRWATELEKCGVSAEMYRRASTAFMAARITFGPRLDRAGRWHGEFSAMQVSAHSPTVHRVSLGTGAAAEFLTDPDSLIRSFAVADSPTPT